MNALTVRQLVADYGGPPVLRGIDLHVDAGGTTSILGRSGCGKTTLLLALAGLLPVRSGSVLLDEKDVTNLAAERRGVVLLHQEGALFPHLDVAGNVEFGLRVQGMPARQRARTTRRLLELVDLDGFETRRVDQLSGGQRQRIALARALAVEPKVLLLDEPFASLDRGLRTRLREEMRELLARLRVTALFVTHDPDEAAWMGDRLLVLDAGVAIDEGPVERVLDAPAVPEAARMLGYRNLVPFERNDAVMITPIGSFAAPDTATERGFLLVPEDGIRFSDSGTPAVIKTVRRLGSSWMAGVDVAGHRLFVRLPARRARPALGPAFVLVDQRQIHAMPDL